MKTPLSVFGYTQWVRPSYYGATQCLVRTSMALQVTANSLQLIFKGFAQDFKRNYQFPNVYQFEEITWRLSGNDFILTLKFWEIDTGEHWQEVFKCEKEYKGRLLRELGKFCNVVVQEF